MTTFLSKLRARLVCAARSHDWKRAVRSLDVRFADGTASNGTRTCRRCGATRAVLLRPKEPASVTAAKAAVLYTMHDA